METNKSYFQNDFWRDRMNVEKATLQVLEEAEAMEDFFFELNENTKGDKKPDFDSVFHYLDGKYKYELLWQPMKSYGNYNPSLLRLYAIKLQEPNTYLITGGGIKLADTIQNSPDLKDHVFQNIDKVRQYLRENGILDSEDLIE